MPQPLSLKIGPSGVRGVIGESLTPQLVTSFAAAFGTYCGAGPILIGTDTRPSGEMVKQAAIAGLLSVGCIPVDVGVVPLPGLMLHVREAGAFGGISVGGNDEPFEWNTLRFVGAEGLALRANQAAELTDLYHQGLYPRVRALDMADVRIDSTTNDRHLRAVTGAVDADRIRRTKFKVAVDCLGGSASIPAARLLEELGCEVVAGGADVAFAIDGDGDRLHVADENGRPLGCDATVVLVVQRRLERKPGPVVVDVSTSRMVDDVAARFGCPVHRSRVGEANVLEVMRERGSEVGGESDGGAIVLPVNFCRDSFAAMAVILEAMAAAGEPLSALFGRVPNYAIIRERLLCPARDVAPSLRVVKALFRGERFDLTDGVKVTWPDRWLMVRPATTEPVLRLAAEAPTETEARSLVNRVLEALSPGA